MALTIPEGYRALSGELGSILEGARRSTASRMDATAAAGSRQRALLVRSLLQMIQLQTRMKWHLHLSLQRI